MIIGFYRISRWMNLVDFRWLILAQISSVFRINRILKLLRNGSYWLLQRDVWDLKSFD